jgi:hypothetical protein
MPLTWTGPGGPSARVQLSDAVENAEAEHSQLSSRSVKPTASPVALSSLALRGFGPSSPFSLSAISRTDRARCRTS